MKIKKRTRKFPKKTWFVCSGFYNLWIFNVKILFVCWNKIIILFCDEEIFYWQIAKNHSSVSPKHVMILKLYVLCSCVREYPLSHHVKFLTIFVYINCANYWRISTNSFQEQGCLKKIKVEVDFLIHNNVLWLTNDLDTI